MQSSTLWRCCITTISSSSTLKELKRNCFLITRFNIHIKKSICNCLIHIQLESHTCVFACHGSVLLIRSQPEECCHMWSHSLEPSWINRGNDIRMWRCNLHIYMIDSDLNKRWLHIRIYFSLRARKQVNNMK